ncbi:helix-turn-helix transcriptional regulator [Sphingobacterium zhuxiongii]|nr:diguanylate cyclase [Sphingobacterium sp. dk4302]
MAIIFIFNERTNYLYALVLIAIIFFFFYLTQIREVQVLNNEFRESSKTSKTTRIHTFIQIICFIGFNAYLLVSKNKEITRLFSQKERSEKIIEQLNNKLKHTSTTAQLEKLINLAMENSALFIPLFKEVFPEVYSKLFEINPEMTSEEFKLCALLKLGFTTKDIATYTHLAVRSVQTKKNRLRKSFHLSSHEDLYLWIESIS